MLLKSRAVVPLRGSLLPDDFSSDPRQVLVVFKENPDAAVFSTMSGNGVAVHGFATGRAWYATGQDDRLRHILAMPQVAGIVLLRPEDKMPRYLAEGDFSRLERDATGRGRFVISWAGGMTPDRVDRILQPVGGQLDGLPVDPAGRSVAWLHPEDARRLAALPEVRGVAAAPFPWRADNATAAARSGVPTLHGSPYNLSGTNVTVAVRDGGSVLEHLDLSGRVVNVTTEPANYHSLHVAGTVAGSGAGSPAAMGMAPEARICAYSFVDGSILGDLGHALTSYSARVSNHSYGRVVGWEINAVGGYDYFFNTDEFGAYGTSAQEIDATVRVGDLLIVKSAGNHRDDADPGPGVPHTHNGLGSFTDSHPHDGAFVGDGYYDCIGEAGCAKNVLAIGATTDADGMSTFSSWGPTDDGRVKPDLVANGVTLYSLQDLSSYVSLSGTSMSSPVVAGSLALLMEQYAVSHAGAPLPADLGKAVLIHCAGDLGRPGPDAQYGWGLLRSDRAAEVLKEDALTGARTRRRAIREGDVHAWTVAVPEGTDELSVTLAWIDEPGDPNAAFPLVNDLDLALLDPSAATVYYPFVLSAVDPSLPAGTGTNTIDTVEQVRVAYPAPGVWTVEIAAPHVVSGFQPYALATSASIMPAALDSLVPILSARFDEGPPAGWSVQDGNADGETWTLTNPGGRGSLAWAGGFMICDSAFYGKTLLDESLLTPSLDLSGWRGVRMRFSHQFEYRPRFGSEIGDVDVSIGGGVWTNVARFEASSSGTFWVDLAPLTDEQSDVQVRWRYHGAQRDAWWGVDAVEIVGIPVDPDEDNDGVPSSIDNCPLAFNPDQADPDLDGNGNPCDDDDDNDGIPDVWEESHLLDPLDPADALLDPDNDLCSSLDEYAAGTDPQDPLSRAEIAEVTVTAADAVTISFRTRLDRVYTVEIADHSPETGPADWHAVTDADFVNAPGDNATWTYVDVSASPDLARYYRVVVTLP